MRNNFKAVLIISLLILVFLPQLVFAQALSSVELIKNAKEYDGKQVMFSGEVIGDIMARGKFAWANINDGDNAIGVWVGADLAKEIDFTGGYKSKGDILEASGTFHRACSQHSGDLDIHAEALRKISNGKVVHYKLDSDKVKAIFTLLGALFLIWILSLFRRK